MVTCGYIVIWYQSYLAILVILTQLEQAGRGPWLLVLTVLIDIVTVCRIMQLSCPNDISHFLLPICSLAMG